MHSIIVGCPFNGRLTKDAEILREDHAVTSRFCDADHNSDVGNVHFYKSRHILKMAFYVKTHAISRRQNIIGKSAMLFVMVPGMNRLTIAVEMEITPSVLATL